ncbi:MAG: NUDIX hydrolase [Verrucomicrobia bacterium]|nr:NUDIX hydrolase [Cytophagales bacterium]
MIHTPNEAIVETYGNKVRVRVCGICVEEDKVVMVKHVGLGESGVFWCPPGGGLAFGESVSECLVREFLEETGLHIIVGKFLFAGELLAPPLHAVELFFEVKVVSGNLQTGHDPELAGVIAEVAWLNESQIREIPLGQIHRLFHHFQNLSDFLHKPEQFIFFAQRKYS